MIEKDTLSEFQATVCLLKFIITLAFLQSLALFLNCRSLWLDEAMIALNIIDRSYQELTAPLSYNQAAPVLFLWAEKITARLFGYSEYGLRLFPLLCYWLNIFLFYKLIKRIFVSGPVLVFLLSLFCFNYWLLSYALNVKQYTTDVTVMLITLLFIFTNRTLNRKTSFFLAIFGVTGIFLSSITPIVLVTLILNYLPLVSPTVQR